MALVKIKVDKNRSGYFEKYLLQFIPQIHYTVKDFLKMAKQILNLDWPLSQIVILKSGYIIPHSLSSRIFTKYQQSTFKIIKLADKKPIKSNKNRQNSQSSQQSSQQNNNQLSSSQSQEVQQRIKKIKSPTLKKNKNKIQKNKKMDIQDQDQQNQNIQFSQQSQSSELPVISNKKNQLQEKKKQKTMKKQKVVEKSNSSESQSDLTQKLIPNKNKSNVSNNIKKAITQDKKGLIVQQNTKINRKQKKKIIEMDSSSQESSQQQKQKFKVNDVKKSQTTLNKIVQAQNRRNNQSSLKIPPSLRQKTEKNTFKTHQQQQWITVSKQILKKHYELQQNKQIPFVKINNLIRFKIIELDQQRFVPVSSQWIEGTVKSINQQGKITLSKVTQINRPFRQTYQICQHNMLELLINKNFILKEQTLFINSDKPEQDSIQLSQEKKIETQNKDQEKNQEKCSIEKFICGQVNFYFSDKNYPTDLFMRMHANNHPQKYFPIRVMLNFPKIKKVLKDQNKLFEYLSTDEKKSERNFQIDQINKMIRKKDKTIINQKNKEQSLAKDQKQQQVNKN